MRPSIALMIVGLVVAGILLVDSRRKQSVSIALWIPVAWLTILASRPLSAWLDPSEGLEFSHEVEAGSAIDRTALLILMVVSAFILGKRKLDWAAFFKNNKWFVAFFFYCGISVLWSDFPAVGFKRWIRALGTLAVILLVVSEPDPIAAIRTLVRRCTYVLVPVSVLLIKYYRELGVEYDYWTGELSLVGVSVNKNGLGRLCLVAGLFGLWDIISTWRDKMQHRNSKKLILSISIPMFLLTLWLLVKSNSVTSLIVFLAGSCVMLALGLPVLRRNARNLGLIAILSISALLAIALSLDLVETAVLGLGRNMTLTSRVPIWAELLGMGTNPILGVGYDTFWLGSRLNHFIERYRVNEAHNGYLEVYLELGIIGLFLLGGFLLTVFRKAKTSLRHPAGFNYGRLQMAALVIFLLYNVTESAYKATTLLFFVLMLVAVNLPKTRRSQGSHAPSARRSSRHVPTSQVRSHSRPTTPSPGS